MLSLISFYALYSTSLPMSKYLLRFSAPLFLAAVRMLLAGTILFVGTFSLRGRTFFIKKEHRWLYIHSIFFGVYLKYLLRNWSLDFMPVAKLAFLLNCSPFIAALFSYLWFKERMSKKQWIGLIVGFFGIMPLVVLKTNQETHLAEFFYVSWPELILFISLVCHTYGLILARQLMRFEGYSPTFMNASNTLGAGLLAVPTAWALEGWFPVTQPVTFCCGLVMLCLISNVICHTFYYNLVKRYSVTFISFTEFISPFFVMFYGWLFLNEVVTWHYFASGFTVLFGLYLFYQDELQEHDSVNVS